MSKLWSIICVLFGMFFIAGCGSTWYGEGNVVGKTTLENVVSCDDGDICSPMGKYCHYLKIVDKYDKVHEGCVSERVWNDAMLDHHIEITKEYN